MKRTKIQRIAALLLCLVFVMGGFAIPASAADGAASGTGGAASAQGGSSSSVTISNAEMQELLDTISYTDYLSEYSGIPDATETIEVDAIEDILLDKCSAGYVPGDHVGNFGGVEALLTEGNGTVSWKVTVPATGMYTIKIVYYAEDDGMATAAERVFRVDGKVPFSEARYLTIKKNWLNEYACAVYSGETSSATVKAEAEALGLKTFTAAQSHVDSGLIRKSDIGKLCVEYPGVWTEAIVNLCEKYALRFFKLDINSNELRPTAYQEPEWDEYVFSDSTGFEVEPFSFMLTEGEHYISLEGKNSLLAIEKIILAPAETVQSYKEYSEQYKNEPAGKGSVKIEAEYNSAASDKTIYAIEDAASAATSPSDPSRTVLNTVGTEKWQTAGQSISYKFKVSSSGMYDIVSRFRQNILDGMFVNRALYIYSEGLKEGDKGYYNGLPFAEARALTYNYGDDWQITGATDGKTDFEFYFAKDVEYTIVFEVTLGEMGDIINTVQTALNAINNDYLAIIQLTGAAPDKYRDYGFSRIMPDVLIDMVEQAYVLNYESSDPALRGVAQKLTELAGQKSSNVGTLQKVSDLLLRMGRDEDEIAQQLTRLKSYIGTLGTFLSDAKTQPLQLDYVLIQPSDKAEPEANKGFWANLWHEIVRFFWSFSRDYDSMGVMSENLDGGLEVWLATGRDQSQVKRNLVNNGFSRDTGIAVDLKLVAGGTLLPSILANQGPDVYHGLGQADVINYAIRSAVLPLYSEDPKYYDSNKEEFNISIDPDDYLDAMNSFNESAMIVLSMVDANGYNNYYGLPETQGFAMMFVRLDILAELGLDIPETWEDIMAAIPVLQAKNMEMGLTTDTNIHLYQMGGTLFADNGMRINLDSQVGLAAFTKMCKFFTDYGFPYVYDPANRFRTGEMPILIGDYTGLYNQLKVFATEIEGLWAMVHVPGVRQEDGSINYSAISAVSASVMVKGSEAKQADAWEYIKWFTGNECQKDYANEMVAIMGPSAKYNTANIEALEGLPWTSEELARIRDQFNHLASVPNYPGSYIIARYTDFAFLAAYNDGEDPAQALLSYISTINKEISRKRAEFGLETLEAGVTLAQKRLGQATEAIKLLEGKNAIPADIKSRLDVAMRSEDAVSLDKLAEDILALTSVDDSVRISKEPDISEYTTAQLLYYLAEALDDAAAALASY